ncbi:MAG TPA: BMP family ABC transporter substrate-binding protein, partial [Clostridia bacterium]|nr:BMP family ABC transporter substrate-binding protein [Clostridia bacterium]
IKKVGDSIYDTVAAFINDDTWKGGTTWVADMASGYVDVGYGEAGAAQQVSDELKAEVEALKQKIISGEIVVQTTRS